MTVASVAREAFTLKRKESGEGFAFMHDQEEIHCLHPLDLRVSETEVASDDLQSRIADHNTSADRWRESYERFAAPPALPGEFELVADLKGQGESISNTRLSYLHEGVLIAEQRIGLIDALCKFCKDNEKPFEDAHLKAVEDANERLVAAGARPDRMPHNGGAGEHQFSIIVSRQPEVVKASQELSAVRQVGATTNRIKALCEGSVAVWKLLYERGVEAAIRGGHVELPDFIVR